MVNERLVQMGYAQVSTYPPNVKYQKRFLKAQREAREAKRGLWGDKPIAKAPPQQTGEIVYVTRTGKKYHRAGCQYLRKSQLPRKKSEAIAQGYGACKGCRP